MSLTIDRSLLKWVGGVLVGLSLGGCVADLPPVTDQSEIKGAVVVGRALAVVTGEKGRRYEPAVRFFEVEHQQTHTRYRVEIDSNDRHFVLPLPPGDYRVNRVQISEGPFMSMADLAALFSVEAESVTYVGTWRFGVDSPGYGRMVAVSMVMGENDQSQSDLYFKERYPELAGQATTLMLPEPSHVETRLYEVMPYPRYSRYFRRHWW